MAPLRYVSFFDGVGMFDLGLRRAGHVCVGACEIDPFARKVRTARLGAPAFYPEDINGVRAEDIPAADLWVGGSPCQGFSVAGKRGGLGDDRSGLLRVWIGLLAARRPRWFLLENVPGILNSCSCAVCGYASELLAAHSAAVGSACACAECGAAAKVRSNHRGRDFGELLRSLGECGYRVGWRILDDRWFGVAQRRRRVFLVASLGDGIDPGRILFESAGGIRDFAASGKAKPGAAGCAARGTGNDRVGELRADDGRRGRLGDEDDLVAVGIEPEATLRAGEFRDSHANGGIAPAVAFLLPGNGPAGRHARETNQTGSVSTKGLDHQVADATIVVEGDSAASTPDLPRLRAGCGRGGETAIYEPDMVSQAISAKWSKGSSGPAGDEHHRPGCGAHPRRGVRRLTPLECERLQSLPDGWTCLCLAKGETARCVCPDGPRYRAIGNGGVVNVMEWLGRRFAAAMEDP